MCVDTENSKNIQTSSLSQSTDDAPDSSVQNLVPVSASEPPASLEDQHTTQVIHDLKLELNQVRSLGPSVAGKLYEVSLARLISAIQDLE